MKKGFTLIEVLAILVVLAILAVITVPMITKTINTAREGVAKSNANSYVSEVEQEIYRRTILGDTLADGQYTVSELTSMGIEVNGTKPSDDGTVIIVNQAVVGYSLTMDGIPVTKEYTGEIPDGGGSSGGETPGSGGSSGGETPGSGGSGEGTTPGGGSISVERYIETSNIIKQFETDVSTSAIRTRNLSVKKGTYYVLVVAYAQGGSLYENPQYAIQSATGLEGGNLMRRANGAKASNADIRLFFDVYYGKAVGNTLSFNVRARVRGYYLIETSSSPVHSAGIVSSFATDDNGSSIREKSFSVSKGNYYILAVASAQAGALYATPQYAIVSASGFTNGDLVRYANGAGTSDNRVFLDIYYGEASDTTVKVNTYANVRGYYLIPLLGMK